MKRSLRRCTSSRAAGRTTSIFHVDFMGGKSNEKCGALREELGEEGGWRSVRFDSAADTPFAYSHEPDV